ncbi:MAG: ABC transporter permease, partial [Phycisphaerae bacterium]|nr:ABC transporter permease [Gemmatimonadaceae bacterium]
EIARFIDDARRDPRNQGKPLAALGVATTLTRDALFSLFASLRNGAPRPIRRRPPDVSFIKRARSFSMEAFLQDIKYALRGFARRPAFTAVALITLALGIGGNSAVFTLVNAVLLKALPYPDPDRLVFIYGATDASRQLPLSVPDVQDLRKRNRTFEDIGIANTQSVNLTGGDRPDRVIGNFVSASSLRILGATTALGRIFNEEETRIGAGEPVVVLSYDTWRSRYGSRTDIIGQKVILNGQPHMVIGVTSASFRDPATCDIWLPISSASRSWFHRDNPAVHGVGRLKAGVTLLDAEKDLGVIAKQLVTEYQRANLKESVAVLDMRESLVGGSRFTLIVLFGAVVAVLLIACVNIANLQLVRASTRQREMSIRAAMGANRARLVSQTLVESLLLALVGGALGVAVGQVAAKFLVNVMPPNMPLMGELAPDWRVLAFSFAMALLTGVLFGAPAAFAGTRTNLNGALRTRSELASTGRFNVRNILVISELALCVVLLAVAGLFTRSMQSLNNVDIGFNAEHVLSAEFRIPAVKYDDSLKVRQFMRSALERLRATPGVVHAAYVGSIPLSGNSDYVPYVAEGQPDVSGDKAPGALFTTISDQYFKTMQIPQLAGRDFTSSDVMGSEPVAIINKTLADKAWPGQNAVGKTLRLKMQPEVTVRVVGVVGAAKQFTMTEETQTQIYVSKEQYTGIFTSVVLRTTGDPDAMNKALHEAIWSVDRDQPIWKVRSLQFLVDRDLAPSRVLVSIINAFALLALLLGTIGVYGVMSFAVQQRSREMGIRMALGARTTQVLNLVLRSGLEVVLIALGIGVAGAMAAGKFVESRLYNIQPSDPATMIGVPLVLGAVALLACYLPARRAARVDPAVTLRSE